MTVLSQFQFFMQVRQMASYYGVNSYTKKHAPYNLNIAWGMYQKAHNPANPFLVFGRTNIDRPEVDRLAGAIEDIELFNLGATNKDFGTRGDRLSANLPDGGGAVLRYQTINGQCGWHVLYNHAWLLGGIHGRTEFHSVSPRTKAMVLSGNGPSMWGHELLFLHFFGYRPLKTHGQEIWIPFRSIPNHTLGDFLTYFNNISGSSHAIWTQVGDPAAVGIAQATPGSRAKWNKTANPA